MKGSRGRARKNEETMSYDEKCYALAKAFLSDHPTHDTPEHCDQLAKDIQQCIEDFFAEQGIE